MFFMFIVDHSGLNKVCSNLALVEVVVVVKTIVNIVWLSFTTKNKREGY